ncbi:MAG: hypothetical protein HY273_16270 [Gammaproteobacteria bacterium]|nr:hypothetical protein [Gammaproteobacteria bacterium]
MTTEIFEAERLPALADLLSELASAASVDPEVSGNDILLVSEIKVELPIEMNLMQEQNVWQLDAAPPTQMIDTTVMPVWHQLRLRVSVDHGERSLDPVES